MGYRLEKVRVSACRIEDNIRYLIVEEEIRLLALSLAQRQIHPILVTTDLRVLDGGKRVRAGRLGGIDELLAIITDDALTPEEIIELQVISAFHRSDPKSYDKWQAMEAIKSAHNDWNNRQIAEHLAIDAKMVKVLLSPGQCVEEVQAALKAERLGISACHEISLLPREEQLPLLMLTLAGSSRDAIAREGRKRRNGTVPAERMKRSRFARPSGNSVTLIGEYSLEEAANELAELVAEMRRAAKDGTTIKTFSASCRDRNTPGK